MKKINLIIISFGLGLTVNFGIGYSLIIPVLIYYLKKFITFPFLRESASASCTA